MDSESDPRGTEVARIDTIDESEWDDQTSEIHIPLEDMHENTVPSLNYAHSDTRLARYTHMHLHKQAKLFSSFLPETEQRWSSLR